MHSTKPDDHLATCADLPWLVNGTLSSAQRRSIQTAVKNSPELQREQDFLVALRDGVRQQPLPELAHEMAWQRLRRDMRRSVPPQVSPRWRMAAIAASLFLLVQSLLMWLPYDNSTQYQPLASRNIDAALLVRFVESAPQARINQLLRQQHLRIVDGPSAAGLYQLASDGELVTVLAVLQQQTELIDYVQAD